MPRKKKFDIKSAAREIKEDLFNALKEVALDPNTRKSIAGNNAAKLLIDLMKMNEEMGTKKEAIRVSFVEIKQMEDNSYEATKEIKKETDDGKDSQDKDKEDKAKDD